jgi:hypothetical protein
MNSMLVNKELISLKANSLPVRQSLNTTVTEPEVAPTTPVAPPAKPEPKAPQFTPPNPSTVPERVAPCRPTPAPIEPTSIPSREPQQLPDEYEKPKKGCF